MTSPLILQFLLRRAGVASLFRPFCLVVMMLAPASLAAADRLPDGGVAKASGSGPVKAWYGRPTGRYPHGVLGDAIEGGSLVAIDDRGRRHEIVLPATHVFEDITPRIADLDGDGRNEIVTIRTSLAQGAAVSVYGLETGQLTERASTPPIGRPNRWLSIAAIAPFTGKAGQQIAVVKTPHIGGVLEILALSGNRLLREYKPQPGFSTHFIGSRVLSLAAASDLTGNGIAELVLPDASRRSVIFLDLTSDVKVLKEHATPSPISGQIRILDAARIEVPLEDATTAEVAFP